MGQFLEALGLVLPVVTGLGSLLLLLLIFRLLRRSMRARALSVVYLGAAALFALALALDGEGLLPPGLARGLIVATLLVAWGYILFDLVEELLIERALIRRGLAVPRLGRDIVRGVAVIALVLLAINQVFGVPLSSLVISSTVASAVLGLALQDLLKNVIAGVALQAERPFAPGDWILVGQQPARVVEMSWRATRLVTPDNTHIILPNANLATAEINNYTIVSPLQALHVQVPLAPDHLPNEVKAVLAQAALAADGVLADPPPAVRLIGHGEYSVTYDIKFWMNGFDRHVETRDAVMTNVWYFTRRAGLRQPHPVRDIFVHQSDDHYAADQSARRQGVIERSLAQIDLFAALSEAERSDLAARSDLRMFGRGELLVRQGDLDDKLYLICRGAVRVEITPEPGAAPVRVSELRAGDFFGELALLTGAPRRATVIAEEDTEALLVSREALAPLFERNPALPEQLSVILERRVEHSQSAVSSAVSVGAGNGADMSQTSLLGRIRSLFGIR